MWYLQTQNSNYDMSEVCASFYTLFPQSFSLIYLVLWPAFGCTACVLHSQTYLWGSVVEKVRSVYQLIGTRCGWYMSNVCCSSSQILRLKLKITTICLGGDLPLSWTCTRKRQSRHFKWLKLNFSLLSLYKKYLWCVSAAVKGSEGSVQILPKAAKPTGTLYSNTKLCNLQIFI